MFPFCNSDDGGSHVTLMVSESIASVLTFLGGAPGTIVCDDLMHFVCVYCLFSVYL